MITEHTNNESCNSTCSSQAGTVLPKLSWRAEQKFHTEGFNVKKLNEVESKRQYQVRVSNRLAALENMGDVGITVACGTVKENIKMLVKV
jgi:hypothetical protein